MMEVKKELLSAAKKGDISAYERLMQDYYKPVYALALKAAVNQEEASSLAQDVFIRIFKGISQLSSENITYQVFKTANEVCSHKITLQRNVGLAVIGRAM